MNSILSALSPTSLPALGERRVTRTDLALLFIVGSLVWMFWRMWNPTTVLELMRDPIAVVSVQTEPSFARSILLRWEYCKHVDMSSNVVRMLRNVHTGTTISLTPAGYRLPQGCHTQHVIEPIPAYVPAGRYVMQLTLVYGTRTQLTKPPEFTTEPFDVPEAGPVPALLQP